MDNIGARHRQRDAPAVERDRGRGEAADVAVVIPVGSPPDPQSSHVATAPPRQLRTVMAGALLAMVLAALDQNIVNTALPRMAADLGGMSHLSW